jgi:hypothetical protein
MPYLKIIPLGAAAAVLLALPGCGHKESSATDTTKALQENFKAADPQVQQAVAQATAAINAAAAAADLEAQRAQYIQALRPVTPLVGQGQLSKEQVKAVQQVYLHVQRAAQQNPKLNNKDFYQAQAALANQLYRAGVMP